MTRATGGPMTTAAAWQRTIDGLDPEAFGELVADDVLTEAVDVLGPDGGAGYTIGRDDLRVLLGMAALGGFRRLIDAVQMEALTGELREDDPTFEALVHTIGVARSALAMIESGYADRGAELLRNVSESWAKVHGS